MDVLSGRLSLKRPGGKGGWVVFRARGQYENQWVGGMTVESRKPESSELRKNRSPSLANERTKKKVDERGGY